MGGHHNTLTLKKDGKMTAESSIARNILNELGVRRSAHLWISLNGNRTYLEIPYNEIMIDSNLRYYKWERIGNLIRIDITRYIRPKKQKKEAHPFGL